MTDAAVLLTARRPGRSESGGLRGASRRRGGGGSPTTGSERTGRPIWRRWDPRCRRPWTSSWTSTTPMWRRRLSVQPEVRAAGPGSDLHGRRSGLRVGGRSAEPVDASRVQLDRLSEHRGADGLRLSGLPMNVGFLGRPYDEGRLIGLHGNRRRIRGARGRRLNTDAIEVLRTTLGSRYGQPTRVLWARYLELAMRARW